MYSEKVIKIKKLLISTFFLSIQHFNEIHLSYVLQVPFYKSLGVVDLGNSTYTLKKTVIEP